MTKMIKLSLVTAVAVASFATAASANGHNEKVKLSGFVSYTMEKVTDANDGVEAQRDLDIRLNIAAPVNDMITANVRVDESNDDDNDGASATDSDSLTMQVDRAYFSYKNDGLTANFGMIGAFLTDGGQADGVTVSKNLGAVSVGAGYAYTSGATKADEVAHVSVSGKVAPVSYSLALANVIDSEDSTNASTGDNKATLMHANVSGNLDMVSVGVDYSSATGMDTAEDQSQVKLTLAAKLAMAAVKFEYAQNGTDGGSTMVDGSDVAASNISMGGTNLQGAASDASAMRLTLSGSIDAKNSVSVAYAAITSDTDSEEENTVKLNYGHKMSKNFSLSANYEINGEAETEELTLGANYSF